MTARIAPGGASSRTRFRPARARAAAAASETMARTSTGTRWMWRASAWVRPSASRSSTITASRDTSSSIVCSWAARGRERSPLRSTAAYVPMTARGLRRSWLTWETKSPRSRSRSRSPCARCSSDPATRPTSLLPEQRDIAVAVAEPSRRVDDGLELLAVTPPGALEQPHPDEEEHQADRSESLGLDQQEIAVEVLRAAGDGEDSQRSRALLGDRAEIRRATLARGRDQLLVATCPGAVDPGQTRAGTGWISPRCSAGSAALGCAPGSPGPRGRRGRECARPRAARSPRAPARRRPQPRPRGGLPAADDERAG